VNRAILLIDTDLGFLFWLGRALDRAGYQSFPARDVPNAIALLAELHLTVGLLILNCSLPGAEDFIADLLRSQSNIKVISLVEYEQTFIPGIDAVCRKPSEISEQSKAELVKFVQSVLLPNSVAF
jgi:ActR/RegA family two-component response regulator